MNLFHSVVLATDYYRKVSLLNVFLKSTSKNILRMSLIINLAVKYAFSFVVSLQSTKRNIPMLFVRGDGVVLVAPPLRVG